MALRPLPEDFRDFIELLNSNKVEYILIGGWAVGLHGNPRTTKDIDFLVENNSSNIEKLQKALYKFPGNMKVRLKSFARKENAMILWNSSNSVNFGCIPKLM